MDADADGVAGEPLVTDQRAARRVTSVGNDRAKPAGGPTDGPGGGMTPHRPGWDVFNPYGAKERCDPQLSEVLSPARSLHTRVRGIHSGPLFRVLQEYDGEVVTELPVDVASNGFEDTVECNLGLRSR
jgi:hypothetical protein